MLQAIYEYIAMMMAKLIEIINFSYYLFKYRRKYPNQLGTDVPLYAEKAAKKRYTKLKALLTLGKDKITNDVLDGILIHAIKNDDEHVLQILEDYRLPLYVAPNKDSKQLFNSAATDNANKCLNKMLAWYLVNKDDSMCEKVYKDLCDAYECNSIGDNEKLLIRQIIDPDTYLTPALMSGSQPQMLDSWVTLLRKIYEVQKQTKKQYQAQKIPMDHKLTQTIKNTIYALAKGRVDTVETECPEQISVFIDFDQVFRFDDLSLVSHMLPNSSLNVGTLKWLAEKSFILKDEDAIKGVKSVDSMQKIVEFSDTVKDEKNKKALFKYLKLGIEHSGLLDATFKEDLMAAIFQLNDPTSLSDDKKKALLLYTLAHTMSETRLDTSLLSSVLEKYILHDVDQNVYLSVFQSLPNQVKCSDKMLQKVIDAKEKVSEVHDPKENQLLQKFSEMFSHKKNQPLQKVSEVPDPKENQLLQKVSLLHLTPHQLFELQPFMSRENWLVAFNRSYQATDNEQIDYITELLKKPNGMSDIEYLLVLNGVDVNAVSDPTEQVLRTMPMSKLYADFISCVEKSIGNTNETYNPTLHDHEMTLLALAIQNNDVKLARTITNSLKDQKLTKKDLKGVSLERFWLFAEEQGVVDAGLWDELLFEAITQKKWVDLNKVLDLMLDDKYLSKPNTQNILEILHVLLTFTDAEESVGLSDKIIKARSFDQIKANLGILKRLGLSHSKPNATVALERLLKEHPDIKYWQEDHLNELNELLKNEGFKATYLAVIHEKISKTEYLRLFIKTLPKTMERFDLISAKVWGSFKRAPLITQTIMQEWLSFSMQHHKVLYAQHGFELSLFDSLEVIQDEHLKTYLKEQKALYYLNVLSQFPEDEGLVEEACNVLSSIGYFPDVELTNLVNAALTHKFANDQAKIKYIEFLFSLPYSKLNHTDLNPSAIEKLSELKSYHTNIMALKNFYTCIEEPKTNVYKDLAEIQKKVLWQRCLNDPKKHLATMVGLLKCNDYEEALVNIKKTLVSKLIMENKHDVVIKLIDALIKTAEGGAVLDRYWSDWSHKDTLNRHISKMSGQAADDHDLNEEAIKLLLAFKFNALLAATAPIDENLFSNLGKFFQVGSRQDQLDYLNKNPALFNQFFTTLDESDLDQEARDSLNYLSRVLSDVSGGQMAGSLKTVHQKKLKDGLLKYATVSFDDDKLKFKSDNTYAGIWGFTFYKHAMQYQIKEKIDSFNELTALVVYDMIMKSTVDKGGVMHLDNLNRYLISINYDSRQDLMYRLALLEIEDKRSKRVSDFLKTNHELKSEQLLDLKAKIYEEEINWPANDMHYSDELMLHKMSEYELISQQGIEWDMVGARDFRADMDDSTLCRQLFMSQKISHPSQKVFMSSKDVTYVIQAGLAVLISAKDQPSTDHIVNVKARICFMLTYFKCDMTGLSRDEITMLKDLMVEKPESFDPKAFLKNEFCDDLIEKMDYLQLHWNSNKEDVVKTFMDMADKSKKEQPVQQNMLSKFSRVLGGRRITNDSLDIA